MVNRTGKGNRVKLKAKQSFEENGYLVSDTEKTGRFAKQKDMFGLFDFVALKEYDVSFVQVTTNTPHTHKKYLEFSKKYPQKNVYFMQGVWYDRKGWKWFTYVNGKKFVKDKRKVK